MVNIPEEKRAYPRIKANLKVDAAKYILGDSLDLSESGISFSSQEAISSPTVSLEINLPGSGFKFKTDAKLVWKRDLESGASLYGVEFIALDETQKAKLRKELLKAQSAGLLNEIKDKEIRKNVSQFLLKDMLEYINEITKLISRLSKQDGYSEELENKLNQLNTRISLRGYCLEEILSDKIDNINMPKIKDSFRHLVGAWVYKSAIMKRAFEKPQGYPGDYRILELFYDNNPISKNIGEYFDNYFLKTPYAVAVRNRKDRLRDMIRQFINQAKLSKLNILNIACGSSREIRELLPTLKTQSHIVFTCFDWDREALKFAQDTLLQIAPKNTEFKFVKDDIINIIKPQASNQLFGGQNLIYSLGAIDYLPDSALKSLIQTLYQLLQPAGKLILTHKNREKTFPPISLDWFCDWKFAPRNKAELNSLFYNSGLSNFSLTCESDDFAYIYYFTLTKNK